MKTLSTLWLVCILTHQALAQGSDWVQQSPPTVSSDLNDLYLFDAATAIAVGANGAILKTTDGGGTWTALSSGTSSNLTAVQFINQNTGWVVGESGTMRKTTDGGTTWSSQNSGSTSRLTSVYFVDAQTGWSTSYGDNDKKIRKTTDGGTTWSVQYTATGTYVSLEKAYFLNASFGFVTGFSLGGPDIFRTTDGGQTWTTLDYPNSWFQTVTFINNQVGWAAGITASSISYTTPDPFGGGGGLSISGQRSTVWKTTDGGLTWASGVFSISNWVYDAHFSDMNNGMLVGSGGVILRTTDGGTNWTSQSSPLGTAHTLRSVQLSGSSGWIVGSGGEILRTTNAGNSWSYQSGAGTTRNLNSLYFTDASTGWAVGAYGTILKTTDGGTLWRGQSSSTTRNLYSVQFVNSTTGWIASTYGFVLRTTNGGTSWSWSYAGSSTLNSLCFIDAQTGWVIGYSGAIYKTTNGGSSWTLQTSGTTARLNGVSFTTPSSGWVVGDSGIVLITTNGGSSWNRSPTGTSKKLFCIYRNQTSAWVGGEGGLILRTTDNGVTWSAIQIRSNGYPIYYDLKSISFVDTSTGWVSAGNLYKTINGGLTWAPLTIGTSQGLGSVFFVNSSTGWVAGANGLILKTITGGGSASYPPTLSLPADRSTGTPTDVTLSWSACAGALSYTLHLSTSPSFPLSGLVEAENLTGISYELKNLEHNTTYYWRVRASYAANRSEWSPAYKFLTIGTEWQAQLSESGSELYAVHFSDELNGWAVGNDYTILRTTDGGSTWSMQKTGLYDNKAVHSPGANTVWIAGSWGIKKSTDGGQTWTTPAGVGSETLNALQFVDASTGYAAGNSNTVLKTADGGATWSKLSVGTGYTPFYSVYFVTPQKGWVVDAGGKIINTTDGGATWNIQSSGGYGSLLSVQFKDEQTGWVCGNGGLILKTTDGGSTWSPQISGTTKTLYSITMVDGQTGWAVGESGTILKTTDGGSTWGCQLTGLTRTLYASHFRSTNVGWTVGGSGLILKTTSGGGRLVSIPLATTPRDSADSVPSDVTFSWRGSAGAKSYRLQCSRVPNFSSVYLDLPALTDTMYRATGLKLNSAYYWRVAAKYDEGQTDWSNTCFFETLGPVWKVHYGASGYGPNLGAVFFTTPQIGFATGGWSLMKTEDAGLHWQSQYLTPSTDARSIWFIDASTGFLVGPSGVILKTTNGGASWTQVSGGTTNNLNAMQFVNATTGWIIGDGGTALRTTNAGATWTAQSVGTTQALTSISFVSSTTGWISTSYGKVLKTTDGGTTWVAQRQGSSYGYSPPVFPLYFVDAMTGWFYDNSSYSLMKTTDGGSTWASQETWTSYTALKSLRFVNSLKGWAVGDYGTIVMTDDGGQLWQRRKSGTTKNLLALCVLNDSTAWATGSYSVILGMSGPSTATGVEASNPGTGSPPTEFALFQNYPNPFNPTTTIRYELPVAAHVTLRIFSILGQEVITLVDEVQDAGFKSADFDASRLPSGVYLCRLKAGPFADTKKLMLLR